MEASIITWETADALRVPASAVFRHDGQWNVFVMQDAVARLREVQIGERNGFDVEIFDGLTEADLVILHPGESVADGVAVAGP